MPNGGARIVQRDDLQLDEPGQLPEAAPGSVEQDVASLPEDEPSATEPPSAAMPDPIDVAVEAQASARVGPGEPFRNAQSPVPARRRRVSAPSTLRRDAERSSLHRMLRWTRLKCQAMTPGQWIGWILWNRSRMPRRTGPEHGRLPRGANTHVFILYVVARSEESFSGMDILETLLACDLRFGDMDFFHRHERASGRGAIEFSVANMMKPGVFDIDNMEPLQTRGLMFFVTLPGPADMLKAFDYMYETVKVVAKALDADIQDETRSVITRQSLEHMRQQIRELERRLLVRRN